MIYNDLALHTNVKVYKNDELVHEEKNKVVDTGLNFICERLKDNVLDPMSHMAVGTGTIAVDMDDTELGTQLDDRVALTSTTVSDNVLEFSAIFEGTTHAGAITEAGIFNAATLGTMLNRVVFGVVTINEPDTLTIVWTLTFANKVE